jgi:putative nucleotidyltransferase with HDIG domain
MRSFGAVIESGFVRAPVQPAHPRQAEPATPAEAPSTWANRLLWALVATVSVAGVALNAYGLLTASGSTDWALLAVLTCLAIAAERMDFSMYGSSRVSLAFVPIFAAIISCGLTGLATVVPCAIVASSWGRPLHKTMFNFGALMISGAAAVVVLGRFRLDYGQDWPQVLLPAVLAGGANFLANTVLVASAIGLSGRSTLREVWKENFLWLLPHYLILALLGLAIVASYAAIGIWGIAVFIAPPLMMRVSIKQYLDRTTKSVMDLRQTHIELQHAHDMVTEAMASLGKAYDGTLRSLVAALDARDSETAGHSERVADLTMAIATEMGIPADTDDWRYLSWGSLLHDVGKIAIPDHILRKPGPLTPEEWDAMHTHPKTGSEILRSVDFLIPASDIVLAHHERFDGGGYPRGLAGEEIPLGARIFMIADSFDAMTSNRTYRSAMPAEEALAEILRHSGSQFDPDAVRAFLAVYQKRFVGTVHHRHFAGSSRSHGTSRELSESLKKAIAEAAGLESLS